MRLLLFPRLLVFSSLFALTTTALATTLTVMGTAKSGNASVIAATATLYGAGNDRGVLPTVLGSGMTDANGRFQIQYTQPAAETVVYVTVKGPAAAVGLASFVNIAGVPTPTVQNIVVNELTTIAMAYALAQFMDGDNIGGKYPGLQNAAATVGNMANITTGAIGAVLGTSPNGSNTRTLAEFNSLANLISTCVDGNAAVCNQLFAAATTPHGIAPTDTLQAALSISHNPWNNVSGLFTLSQNNSNYSPVLTAAPDAWTIALLYLGRGNGREINGPGNMAIDADGNIYISINYDGALNACGGKIVTKLSPTGFEAPGSPFVGGGLNGAGFGATIDPSNHLWIGNFGFKGSHCPQIDWPPTTTVSKFTLQGQALSPPGGWTGLGYIHRPQATVTDFDGNIWVANYTATDENGHVVNYITELVGGDPFNVKTYINNSDLKEAFGIAIDADNKVWMSSAGTNSVIKLDPSNGSYTPYTPTGLKHPMGVAIDSLGNVWISNIGGGSSGDRGSVVALDKNGHPLEGSPFTGGSIDGAWGNAVDGNDNVWINDWVGLRVTELCGVRKVNCPYGSKVGDQISPPNGYTSDALERPTGVVIDSSGNVWLPNNWLRLAEQRNPGGFGMVELVGAAGPVKTPSIGPPRQP
jgi:hypothetical protein